MQTVFILGAGGHFGRHAQTAFANAGWIVRTLARPGTTPRPGSVQADPFDPDALSVAALGADVIVNGLNPLYHHWARDIPRITRAVIAAARASGATVMIPGNVYNFGATMPTVLKAETPWAAETRKGRLRMTMERAYRDADISTIVLRAGDFWDVTPSGNWFDTHISRNIAKGTLAYPGATDQAHAWAFLPDLARAMAMLADQRTHLPRFADIPFPGYTLSGQQLAAAAARAIGRPISLRSFPWWAIRLVSPFMPLMRELQEMRYLWNVPHGLDGTALAQVLPDFAPTPLEEALRAVFAQGRDTSTQTKRWSEAVTTS